jgi:hypothetical protein
MLLAVNGVRTKNISGDRFLWYTDSDYLIGIFKLFLKREKNVTHMYKEYFNILWGSRGNVVLHFFPFLRRVWRYQWGNQNLYIKEKQTKQWPKEEVQKDKQWSTKHTHKTKDQITQTPLKTGDELRCSGRVFWHLLTKLNFLLVRWQKHMNLALYKSWQPSLKISMSYHNNDNAEETTSWPRFIVLTNREGSKPGNSSKLAEKSKTYTPSTLIHDCSQNIYP